MADYKSAYAGGGESYKMFYTGFGYDGSTAEARACAQENGWHLLFGSDEQGLNGDTWVVYRDVSDLPAYLQEYARMMEAQLDVPAKYYDKALGLDGTADELFIQARNGYIENPAALAKIQEILSNAIEKKYDKAFYVGVLKEIAEDAGDKPYVFGRFKKDVLDGVKPEEVELRDGLTLSIMRDRESVVISLDDAHDCSQGNTVMSVEHFLWMSAGEFQETIDAVYGYNMAHSVAHGDDLDADDDYGDDDWEELDSKIVRNRDGEFVDYTLFYHPGAEKYACFMGDKDLFFGLESVGNDEEFDNAEEAYAWFDKYVGLDPDKQWERLADKRAVIRAMDAVGYTYMEDESYDGHRCFLGHYGTSLEFRDFEEAKEWLGGFVVDNPDVAAKVDKALRPRGLGRLVKDAYEAAVPKDEGVDRSHEIRYL